MTLSSSSSPSSTLRLVKRVSSRIWSTIETMKPTSVLLSVVFIFGRGSGAGTSRFVFDCEFAKYVRVRVWVQPMCLCYSDPKIDSLLKPAFAITRSSNEST